MSLVTTAPRQFCRCFYIDAQRLHSLWNIVNEGGDAEITFRSSDNNAHTTKEINDLLSYTNADSARIIYIKLQGSYRSNPRIDIEFESDPRISIRISGDSSRVIGTERAICQILEGASLKFPVFSRWLSDSPHRLVIFSLGVVAFLIQSALTLLSLIWILNLFRVRPSAVDEKLMVAMANGWFVADVMAYFYLTGPWLAQLGRYIFPPANFAIGDGIRRFDRAKNVRTLVLILVGLAMIVSVVGSLLTAYLYDYLKGR